MLDFDFLLTWASAHGLTRARPRGYSESPGSRSGHCRATPPVNGWQTEDGIGQRWLYIKHQRYQDPAPAFFFLLTASYRPKLVRPHAPLCSQGLVNKRWRGRYLEVDEQGFRSKSSIIRRWLGSSRDCVVGKSVFGKGNPRRYASCPGLVKLWAGLLSQTRHLCPLSQVPGRAYTLAQARLPTVEVLHDLLYPYKRRSFR